MTLAAPLISQDTLLETGRVNRPPLGAFAHAIQERLAGVDGTRESWPIIAIAMNNASLVEVFRGEPRRAHDLCEVQLRWAHRLIRRHGPALAGELALQPWINVGRLLRIEGRHEEARRHFSLLADLHAGRSVSVGSITFEATTFQDLVASRSLTGFLESVYLVDTVKSYAAATDFEGAWSFLSECRALLGQGSLPILDELTLITHANLGRSDQALAVTDRPSWQQDAFSRLCRVTYRVPLLAAVHGEEAVRPLATELTARVLRAGLDRPGDQRILRYLHYLGRLLLGLGLEESAASVFRLGLGASRHFVDVPLELSFLESLLALDGAGDRQELSGQREAILRECLYVTLLRPRGITPDPAAAADPVFEQVRRRLESIATGTAVRYVAEAVCPPAP